MQKMSKFEEKTILIVDDSEIIREIIRRELKKQGFKEIFQAENGVQALEIYFEKNPDIVIMDIRMPIKNGVETAEEIIKKDNKAKIILMSSIKDEGFRIQSFLRGVAYYLPKPFSKEELKEAVIRVLYEGYNRSNDAALSKYEKRDISIYTLENYDETDDLEDYVRIIGELLSKIKDKPEDFALIEILQDNIDTFSSKKISEDVRKRVELLKTKIGYFEEGLLSFDGGFFEECIYILNDIRKGVKAI